MPNLTERWKEFRDAGGDRFVELLMVFGVAFVGILQFVNSCSNNASTSQQTNQLIAAAKISAAAAQQNALAASNFAENARKISEGVNQAVDRLNAQAQATSDIATAAVAQSNSTAALADAGEEQIADVESQIAIASSANAIAQQSLEAQTRPWIGIDDEGPQNFKVNAKGTVSFDLPLRNYGRSPAIVVRSSGEFVVAGLGKEEFRFWKDGIEKDLCDFERLPGTARKDRIPRLTLPIFPNTDKPVFLHVEAERQDTTDPIPAADDLSGCIVYNVKPDSSYITRLIYRVQYSNGGSVSFVRMDAQ